MEREIAVFGGGCFWCTEAVFKSLRGIISILPGYSGGTIEDPTYEQVLTGTTGHAEAIKLEFDPKEISYAELLTVFFATHDPTTRDRQGNDIGSQYRSVIFYVNDKQKEAAESKIADINRSSDRGDPVVTEVVPFKDFYEAEDYHKNFYERNSDRPYCLVVINPKLQKLQKEFANLLNSNIHEQNKENKYGKGQKR